MNPEKHLINLSGSHTVEICLDETYRINLVTRYIKDGLLNGEAVFVIAKAALIRILKSKTDGLNFDGIPLRNQDQIRFFTAEILLAYLRADDGLEEEAFHQNVVVPIKYAQSKYKRIRALGEMFDILWKQGQHDMLIQLINHSKNLTNTQELIFLHTYSLDHLDRDSHKEKEALERICKYHSHLAFKED